MYHKRLTFNIPEQEHILNTHIDQLAQWYASAEQITKTNLPRIGDALVFPYSAEGYAIEVEEDGWTPDDLVPGEPVRILARAPKPKPAWHDAAAIMARYDDTPTRYALLRDGDRWINVNDEDFMDDELEDVTPLIEAKVTDEMIERASHAVVNWTYSPRPETTICLDLGDKGSRALVGTILTAALGLEAA